MTDLVGTCPKTFWDEWIAEGGAAGAPETGEEWGWYTKARMARVIRPGDRFYIVAGGRLRGWAPVVRLDCFERGFAIIRQGGAVVCSLAEAKGLEAIEFGTMANNAPMRALAGKKGFSDGDVRFRQALQAGVEKQ
jgi:hypothetical protein